MNATLTSEPAPRPGDVVKLLETGAYERVQSFNPQVNQGLVLRGVPGFYSASDVEPLPRVPSDGAVRLFADRDPRGGGMERHWPWIYFHGKAERLVDQVWNVDGPGGADPDAFWCAPDLISSETTPEALGEGQFPVEIYGQPAVLFLWHPPAEPGVRAVLKGLAVLESDAGARAYALRCYRAREPVV